MPLGKPFNCRIEPLRLGELLVKPTDADDGTPSNQASNEKRQPSTDANQSLLVEGAVVIGQIVDPSDTRPDKDGPHANHYENEASGRHLQFP